MWRALVMLVLLGLAACGSTRAPVPGGGGAVAEPVSCVPYARARSGIQLSGDAWTWWDAAAGRYERSQAPQPGSVLVINRTARMRSGHVAVVTRVVSSREILVDHANWASGAAKGRIARDQRVVDISSANDWSVVRVWYPRINNLGASGYPVRGFVHPRMSFASAD
ncbi:CHAP domain-containing protein [Roseomonas sp. AR75]|uniref:CHAP domain-containing protein n=1 Tax=Roseomonas sp. AR75 TaxID=2562311 RepID=UPI0010BFCC57|nr:CHAP domain-containing protein [Roseomonas sp. AR75]